MTFDISEIIDETNQWTVNCRNPDDNVTFLSAPFQNLERKKITIACDLKMNQELVVCLHFHLILNAVTN